MLRRCVGNYHTSGSIGKSKGPSLVLRQVPLTWPFLRMGTDILTLTLITHRRGLNLGRKTGAALLSNTKYPLARGGNILAVWRWVQ